MGWGVYSQILSSRRSPQFARTELGEIAPHRTVDLVLRKSQPVSRRLTMKNDLPTPSLMCAKNVFVHLVAYSVIAPFMGGGFVAFAKYVCESTLPPSAVIVASILAGIFSIPFYCVMGAALGLGSLVSLKNYWLHLPINLLASMTFVILASYQDDFFDGYRITLAIGAVIFTAVLNRSCRNNIQNLDDRLD